MRYGRAENGDRWHVLVRDDKALCYKNFDLVEFPRDEVCENCDERMRDKGKEGAKEIRRKTKRPDPRTVYAPRFRFKD